MCRLCKWLRLGMVFLLTGWITFIVIGAVKELLR